MIYIVYGEYHDYEYDEFRIIKSFYSKEKADEYAKNANEEIIKIKKDYSLINGSTNGIWSGRNKYINKYDKLYESGDWMYLVEEVEIE